MQAWMNRFKWSLKNFEDGIWISGLNQNISTRKRTKIFTAKASRHNWEWNGVSVSLSALTQFITFLRSVILLSTWSRRYWRILWTKIDKFDRKCLFSFNCGMKWSFRALENFHKKKLYNHIEPYWSLPRTNIILRIIKALW